MVKELGPRTLRWQQIHLRRRRISQSGLGLVLLYLGQRQSAQDVLPSLGNHLDRVSLVRRSQHQINIACFIGRQAQAAAKTLLAHFLTRQADQGGLGSTFGIVGIDGILSEEKRI
jgi:hypothetical protein